MIFLHPQEKTAMTAVPFDTLKFVETLRKAGVAEQQAIAHKDALSEAAFATKADLREMELRLTIKVGAMIATAIVLIAAIGKLFWGS